MNRIDAIELGASLYVPATRSDLRQVASGDKHPQLRSAIVCLEDAVLDEHVARGLANLADLAVGMAAVPQAGRRPHVFVRPRNAEMLERIVAMPGSEAFAGFVVPKATAGSLPAYIDAVGRTRHRLMPTVETREAFDPAEMAALRRLLEAHRHRIMAVRIGGNDLLQTIGARRSMRGTAYDGPLGTIIADLVCAFAPWGFDLSAPVMECFGDPATLAAEVERDLEHGLATKTAIHPDQVATIQDAYRVDAADLATAHRILDPDAPAVFTVRSAMIEPATHRRWAEAIARRATMYGIRSEIAGAATRSA